MKEYPMSASTRQSKFEAYADQLPDFAIPIFGHLRALVHATCPQVSEEVKWSIPHFVHGGENLCIFAAYAKHCSFSFAKDSLMADPRLKSSAARPAAKRFMGRLTTLSDLPPDDDLAAWIAEAMSLNDRGIKLPPRQSDGSKPVEVPQAFTDALAANPAAKAVFDTKSPSFRKEYNVWIGDAKTDATRQKRIGEALTWIAEGKGRFWKYAK
jgi:uncharacterized protein YdeI (YjbR/CyaY-like superfamily)